MGQPRSMKGADDIRRAWNDSSSVTIAKAIMVKRASSGAGHVALPGGVTERLFGVTMEAIPPKSWGNVQIRGLAKCTAAGALATLGVALMSDTAGKVVAWSASADDNAQLVGTLETTAGADGDIVEVELAGPGALQQG